VEIEVLIKLFGSEREEKTGKWRKLRYEECYKGQSSSSKTVHGGCMYEALGK
jgi:hypothetical protein